MRKHYVTLCMRGNTVVTYMPTSRGIEVTFEQPIYNGFKTLVLTIEGKILSVEGFNPSEVSYYIRFLAKNRRLIENRVIADA